jgi:hypothetical protein
MEGMIQIRFEISEDGFSYSDALYLPQDHSFTEQQIEAMKRERFDNWRAIISNPPPGPTDEELIAAGVVFPDPPTEQPIPTE